MLSFVFPGAESYLQFHCNTNKQISICSVGLTCVARGYSFAFWLKNLQTSRWSARIFPSKGEHPSDASHALWVSSKLKPMVDIQIKKCRTMKTNNNISNSRGKTSTSGFNQIKKVVKVLVILIGSTIELVLWVFIRPIFRGVGWLISILMIIAIIYWLMTF